MAEQSKKKKTSGASPEIVDIPEDAVVPSKGKGGKAAGEKAKAASAKSKASSAKSEFIFILSSSSITILRA